MNLLVKVILLIFAFTNFYTVWNSHTIKICVGFLTWFGNIVYDLALFTIMIQYITLGKIYTKITKIHETLKLEISVRGYEYEMIWLLSISYLVCTVYESVFFYISFYKERKTSGDDAFDGLKNMEFVFPFCLLMSEILLMFFSIRSITRTLRSFS